MNKPAVSLLASARLGVDELCLNQRHPKSLAERIGHLDSLLAESSTCATFAAGSLLGNVLRKFDDRRLNLRYILVVGA